MRFHAILAFSALATASLTPAKQYRREASPDGLVPRQDSSAEEICGNGGDDCGNGWCCLSGQSCKIVEEVPFCETGSGSTRIPQLYGDPVSALNSLNSKIDQELTELGIDLPTGPGDGFNLPQATAESTNVAGHARPMPGGMVGGDGIGLGAIFGAAAALVGGAAMMFEW